MTGNGDLTTSWLNFAQQPVDQGGLGLAPHQAAGLVGNLQNESGQGLTPWGVSGDNGTAQGTAQWRGDRLAALKQAFPDSYQTPQAQQAFMRQEMFGPENKAYQAIKAAGSPEDAAAAVNHLYERSADTTGNREKAARQLMQQLGGGGALSFANEDDDASTPTPGALSPNNALGQGALQTIIPGEEDKKGYFQKSFGARLAGAGAALAGISNPQQGYVLTNLAKQMRDKDTADDKTNYKISVTKDGRIIRVNPSTGEVQSIGGGAGAGGGPQMLGDPTKQGDDYIKTLDPVTQRTIQAWHDGTGVAPSSYALSKNPMLAAQMAAAQQAYPDMDFSRIGERKTFANDMAKTTPSSVGGQIASSLASMKHLNNLTDNYVDLHNSNGGGWTQIAHGLNMAKDQFNGTERSSKMNELQRNGSLASGEITKFITGNGGGVHEREELAGKLANSHFSPEEAAGVLEAQRSALREKHDVLVEKARHTMGDGYLARHPEIEQTYNDLDGKLRDKIASLHISAKSETPASTPALPKGVTSIQVIPSPQ